MSLDNRAGKDAIQFRREVVAELRLRGLSMREIAKALAERGIINPVDGTPYSQQTIKNDIDALRKEWKDRAIKDITEHMARQLAEIEQVRRKAWADDDLTTVLKALELEMKLLGTAAPDRVELNAAIVGAVKLYATENSPDIWDADTNAGGMTIIDAALASGRSDDEIA